MHTLRPLARATPPPPCPPRCAGPRALVAAAGPLEGGAMLWRGRRGESFALWSARVDRLSPPPSGAQQSSGKIRPQERRAPGHAPPLRLRRPRALEKAQRLVRCERAPPLRAVTGRKARAAQTPRPGRVGCARHALCVGPALGVRAAGVQSPAGARVRGRPHGVTNGRVEERVAGCSLRHGGGGCYQRAYARHGACLRPNAQSRGGVMRGDGGAVRVAPVPRARFTPLSPCGETRPQRSIHG